MIKLIMFDFDGVIEDNYELHYQMSKKKTIDITREEHRKMFEGNIHLEREKFKDRDTGFDFVRNFSDTKKSLHIKKEIKETLIKLSKKYILGIVTSGYEYGVNDYLSNNKISNIFSFIYGYETDKIKIHKFEKVLNKFNLGKNECIYVTDTLGDILEAKEIGIRSIAVDFGYHEKERLEKGNPYKIISNFKELITTIKEFENL